MSTRLGFGNIGYRRYRVQRNVRINTKPIIDERF